MLGVILCPAGVLFPADTLCRPLHRYQCRWCTDCQITECHRDGGCRFDATLLTCVSSTVSSFAGEAGWPGSSRSKTGVADIQTCPTANVSDRPSQSTGDGHDWGNVPGLCECGELDDHQTCHPRQVATCTCVIDALLFDKVVSKNSECLPILASFASSRYVVLGTPVLYNW